MCSASRFYELFFPGKKKKKKKKKKRGEKLQEGRDQDRGRVVRYLYPNPPPVSENCAELFLWTSE